MSHLIFLTKKIGRNQNQGETSQGEMSQGEMSVREKCLLALSDMSKHSISIMYLILYEFPILWRQVAIKILAGKSDFSCPTWNEGALKVKVFLKEFFHCFQILIYKNVFYYEIMFG